MTRGGVWGASVAGRPPFLLLARLAPRARSRGRTPLGGASVQGSKRGGQAAADLASSAPLALRLPSGHQVPRPLYVHAAVPDTAAQPLAVAAHLCTPILAL